MKPPETTSSLEVPSPLDLSDRWVLPSQVGSWVRISLPVDTATIPIPIFLGTERTYSLTDNRGDAYVYDTRSGQAWRVQWWSR